MAENLKTTKFRNGSLIGTTASATQNIGNESAPVYQWACNGEESNVATYGRLYTWFAATDPRNICPVGWHLPNDAEWNTLINFLGHPNDVAGKLKESGTAHWQNPNTGATNSSGFTALPGGRRSYDRPFIYFGTNGYWYSSTLKNSIVSVLIMGYTDYAITQGSNFDGKDGMSVRCLKD